tara:strand:- start:506 stop:790 length:285 start_codon:yes stop_codon:yes gene_type:complete
MGLHVCIYREGPKGEHIEHPEWDALRMSGDRDLPSLMSIQRNVGHPYDCEFWQRPEDPAAMRVEMERRHPENAERWRQLEAILSDPEWWVYFSY